MKPQAPAELATFRMLPGDTNVFQAVGTIEFVEVG